MRVILLGQPELKQAVSSIPQLSQRVKLFFHLEGLTGAETAEYIDYRLLVSGHGGNKLFDDETVREIHKLSKGIPRLINKLCDGMMMCAYAEDRPFIDPYDLQGIRKDLLGEDVPENTGKPQPGTRGPRQGKKRERADLDRNIDNTSQWAGSTKALLRIAEALESIDSRLAKMDPDEKQHEDRRPSADNVKPLSPGRK